MYQRTLLDIEAIPHVDIDFMNSTHVEEIHMVNDLGRLIMAYQEGIAPSDEDAKEILTHLNRWFEHTVLHFERENTLMEETGFPAYGVHSQEHEIALDRMKTVL